MRQGVSMRSSWFCVGEGTPAHYVSVCRRARAFVRVRVYVDGVGFSPPNRTQHHHSDHRNSIVRITIPILLISPITFSSLKRDHVTGITVSSYIIITSCLMAFWCGGHFFYALRYHEEEGDGRVLQPLASHRV